MSKISLGYLSSHDPLHHYLRQEIQPQMGGRVEHPCYRVHRLHGSHDVYQYEEKHSGVRMIGKFFCCAHRPDSGDANRHMVQEFDSLRALRGRGLTGRPHRVVRPLGCQSRLNSLLMVEFCDGESLSDVIETAIHRGDRAHLFRKLTALAFFLATLHNRTVVGESVDFHQDCAYTDRLIQTLRGMHAMGHAEAVEFYALRDRWRGCFPMWEDRQVTVHGDATPSNFMFGAGLDVTALDLERSRRADRVFDTGRIAGELKHFFLRATGNRHAAEPFIGHFLWEYACHFPDRQRAFAATTGRVPFYMGITLLRIARNSWVSPSYRRQLMDEARHCLRSGL